MKYRNTKTGAVICTHCKVTGETWEPLPDGRQTPPAQTQDPGTDDEESPAEPENESPAVPENDAPETPAAKTASKTAKPTPKRSGKKGS